MATKKRKKKQTTTPKATATTIGTSKTKNGTVGQIDLGMLRLTNTLLSNPLSRYPQQETTVKPTKNQKSTNG